MTATLTRLPVARSAFRAGARFADQHGMMGIPSGDALHLAICAELGLTLCTLDRRLAQVGLALGIETRLL